MSGMLRSYDYILTLHGGCFSFRSASPSAAILNNYTE